MTYSKLNIHIHTLDTNRASPRTLRRWFARIPLNPPVQTWAGLFGVTA